MKYIIRFWTSLIGLLFALSATVVTAFLGFACSAILFVCALACTPIFYFFPNASEIIEQSTKIVTSPLQFAGSTITAVWDQLFVVITGEARQSGTSETARATALTAILGAFSAACFVGVAIAPISNYTKVVGYIAASVVIVIVWAVASIRLSHNSDGVIRVSTVSIVIAVYAATIAVIAISNFGLQSLALALAVVVLLLLSVIAVTFVWDDTK